MGATSSSMAEGATSLCTIGSLINTTLLDAAVNDCPFNDTGVLCNASRVLQQLDSGIDFYTPCISRCTHGFCERQWAGHESEPFAATTALFIAMLGMIQLKWDHRDPMVYLASGLFLVNGIGSYFNHVTALYVWSFCDGMSQMLVAWIILGLVTTTMLRHVSPDGARVKSWPAFRWARKCVWGIVAAMLLGLLVIELFGKFEGVGTVSALVGLGVPILVLFVLVYTQPVWRRRLHALREDPDRDDEARLLRISAREAYMTSATRASRYAFWATLPGTAVAILWIVAEVATRNTDADKYTANSTPELWSCDYPRVGALAHALWHLIMALCLHYILLDIVFMRNLLLVDGLPDDLSQNTARVDMALQTNFGWGRRLAASNQVLRLLPMPITPPEPRQRWRVDNFSRRMGRDRGNASRTGCHKLLMLLVTALYVACVLLYIVIQSGRDWNGSSETTPWRKRVSDLECGFPSATAWAPSVPVIVVVVYALLLAVLGFMLNRRCLGS